MSEPWTLPAGWRWLRFRDAARVASNLVDPAGYLDLPHIAPNHIESNTGRLLPHVTVKEDGVTSPKHHFQSGQVLYSKIRPYLAKVVVAEFDGLCSADMYPIESEVLEPRFLKWWMLHPEFTRLASGEQARTVLPKINRRALDLLPVPAPPLEEQRRIVEILEDHLSRLEAADRSLTSAMRRGEHLELAAIESLTSANTPLVRLKDVAVSSGYGTSMKCIVDGPGMPVVRIPNIVDGTVDLTDEKRAADATIDLSGLMLRPGDVLFVRTNGSKDLIGRTAVVPTCIEASFASYLIRYQFDTSRVLPAWVRLMMERPSARVAIERLAASSAGQHNLSLGKINQLEMPLPDTATQRSLIEQHNHAIEGPRRLILEAAKAKRRSAALRRSLLVAAFSGRLTGSESDIEHAEETAGVRPEAVSAD